MELQSARALKAEVIKSVLAPYLVEAGETRRVGVAASSLRRVTRVQAGIAIGIARRSRHKDFALALRVQRRGLEADQRLRERIAEVAQGEVDLRYVGRITKRSYPGGTALPWHQSRQRPLLIGSSIGHHRVTAGTLGAFAISRKTREPVVLSNNHVLANENKAALGDAILQPGAFDGGRRSRDQVATLMDYVHLKTDGANLVDAAIAGLDQGISFDPATLTDLGSLRGMRAEPVEPGTKVMKVGRTTGATRGVVTAIELDDVVVSYDQGDLSFDRQIEIEGDGDVSFSQGGDSGSLIVDEEGFACGLLFAGSDQGGSRNQGLTFANELDVALDALNAELATYVSSS